MKPEPQKLAGALLFVAAAQFLVGMLFAEALYPGYSISGNYISDLGATCNGIFPNAGVCVIHQPTANIFNSSVILLGVLLVIAAYVFWRSLGWKIFAILVLLTGIGAMGVGVFPETAPVAHEITSDIAFIFAGISAIWGYRLTKAPMSYFSVILGVVSLVAIVLFTANVLFGLGVGGMERMIVYPVILWAVGFGSYLLNSGAAPVPSPLTPAKQQNEQRT
jgi:hypothetical membrane protein